MAELTRIKDFLTVNGGVLAPGSILEEESYIPEELEHAGNTTNLEAVGAKSVTVQEDSEFRFFEDGIQRTLYVGHIVTDGAHIPVHYCTVAAVILQRTDKRFHLAGELFERRDMLLVSKANVPRPSSFSILADAGIEVVDTEEASRNFNALCRRAQYRSKRERLELEAKLIERWSEAFDDDSFLVLDGTLMNLRGRDALTRCIGVSKEILERYFNLAEHKRIFGLRLGERSWVFRFKTEEQDARMGGRDRLSWYLRIRDTKGRHPEFGLLRCELAKKHADRAPELADRLSRSLIAERYPISHPDPRWDRLIYPIRQCEQYLRSRSRPISSIQAAFGRTQRI